MQSKLNHHILSITTILIAVVLATTTIFANAKQHHGVLDSLREHHQLQHNHKIGRKKSGIKTTASSSAAAAAAVPPYQPNVKFGPLDPKVTNPADYWMELQNPIPEEYVNTPRFPIVPTPGPLPMDILEGLFPNGTVPQVPPKPTNTWHKNLWGFEFNSSQWGAVYPYPYIVQPRAYAVSMMYPGAPRNLTGNRAMIQGFSYPGPAPPGNPPIYNASYPYMTMAASFDFQLQIINGEFPKISQVNELSAQVDYFSTADNKTAVASLYVVKGSPFVTMTFNNAVLQLGCIASPTCPIPPIIGMNNLPPGSKVTSTKFTFQVAEGPLHAEATNWHVYFSSPVTITLPNPPNQPLQIVGRASGGAYTGMIKFATGENHDDEESLLDEIHHTVAIGAEIEYDINNVLEQSSVRFKWTTVGPGPLTMLALPHHLKVLPKDGSVVRRNTTTFWCVRGNLTAVTANVWNMTYNLTNVGFGDQHTVSQDKQAVIKAAALYDYQLRINRCPGDNDTYNGTNALPGHQSMELYAYVRDLSQYSEIAIVLENLGEREKGAALTRQMMKCMEFVMLRPVQKPTPCPPPINNSITCIRNMSDVYYDNRWGGLITGWYNQNAAHYCQCDKGSVSACVGLNYCDNTDGYSAFENYGNAFYNDHHFQYGYILRAVSWAIYYQNTLNADVGIKNTTQWATQALAFARDIANPDPKRDPYFTFLRHKDVFDGISNAEGYSYSGRIVGWVDQQSGGEAVNGYMGVYLLGVALNDTNVRDWGRIQMATEALSVHTYQHLTNNTADNKVLPTPEINNWGKCLSILFGNGASGATYYGPNPIFQCGITLLPITAYTREWVQQEWAKEAVAWMRWHDNRTGPCIYFDPQNKSMVNNNPCPGEYNNKSYTGNAYSCCATNDGAPLNQWRSWPNWYPYLYVLDSLAGKTDEAFSLLQYTNGFDKPTKAMPFPYTNQQGTIIGFQHDLTLTQALFFVASEKPQK